MNISKLVTDLKKKLFKIDVFVDYSFINYLQAAS